MVSFSILEGIPVRLLIRLRLFFSSWTGILLSVGIALLALVVAGLAFGWIPGLPQSREKNITAFYPPHADALGVSLFLQPPLATQVLGESQLIPLQFTSHEKTPAQVSDLSLLQPEQEWCFELTPSPTVAHGTVPKLILEPGQTVALLYRLHALGDRPDCRGQRQLVFSYSWLAAAPAPHPAPAVRARRGKRKHGSRQRGRSSRRGQPVTPPAAAPAPLLERASISTSPIELVTPVTRAWERIFHVVGLILAAVLLPVFIALLNASYQDSQQKRESRHRRADKARELRQQVAQQKQDIWKAIFPGMLILTQQHYLPLLRRMDFLTGAIKPLLQATRAHPATQSQVLLFLDRVILFRAQTRALQKTFGGYHFRSKPGEELYGTLEDIFWFSLLFDQNSPEYAALATLIENAFPNAATVKDAFVPPVAGTSPATEYSTVAAAMALLSADGHKVKAVSAALTMLQQVLAFECDRPLYPEWYSDPPLFPYAEFAQHARDLLAAPSLHSQAAAFQELVTSYLTSIPKECRVP